MKDDWLEEPPACGLYWAYSPNRCNGQPSICKVNILSEGRWSATFLPGTRTYTFTAGVGWVWKPAKAPAPPRRTRAAA